MKVVAQFIKYRGRYEYMFAGGSSSECGYFPNTKQNQGGNDNE